MQTPPRLTGRGQPGGPLALGLILSLLAAPAAALPPAPAAFCEIYSEAPACRAGTLSCDLCHTSPPARNPYGASLEAALDGLDLPSPLDEGSFLGALPEAAKAIEAEDSDGDGVPNGEEIYGGSPPGDGDVVPLYDACDEATAALASQAPKGWNVCGYDPVYVLKKLNLDFCGRSPALADVRAFEALVDEGGDWQAALDGALDACLKSPYWIGQDGALWSLANEKIVPAQAVKSGENAGGIPLGDYEDDYQLFAYTQSGDRDARELLTAQYFVQQDKAAPTQFEIFTRTPVEDFQARGFGGAQLVHPDQRAGMLTTRWFLVSNTMFTSVPRTSAAQAYRAYLGYNIAQMEGLHSVPGEPVDYDTKDVTRGECAVCHATLDPLTYPFSRYDGLGGGEGGGAQGALQGGGAGLINPDGTFNIPIATYTPDRLDRFTAVDGEKVADTPEAGLLLGQPVANLLEWAQVAANSDDFARRTVRDYWRLLMGADPTPAQSAEFDALWRAFKTDHDYRVERLLHALISTEAYGVP